MTRLVEALKRVGETFELFQRGEIGPCDSSPSAVPVANLVPATFCRVPAVPKDELIEDKIPTGLPLTEDRLFDCTPKEVPSAPPRVLTYTQKDVIDDHISIPAQHSLVRLSKNPETSTDAVGMLESVKSRQLEGIYCVNWGKPAKRAIKLGSNWWTIIPEGEDAVLMLDPEDVQGGLPMIAFRRKLHPDCGLFDDEETFPPENARLDGALLRTWQTFKRFRQCEIVPCSLINLSKAEPSGEPTAPETCLAPPIFQPLLLSWPSVMVDLLPPDTRLLLRGQEIPDQQKHVIQGIREADEVQITFDTYMPGTQCTLTALSEERELVLWAEQVAGDPERPEIWSADLSELIPEVEAPLVVVPIATLLTPEDAEEGVPAAIAALA